MKRERWLGYIKDYDGGTLMECAIEERLDYLTTRAVVDGQRQAIVAKVNTLSNAHVQHDGLGGGGARARAAGLPHSVPGLAKTSWAPAAVECTVGGRPPTVHSTAAGAHEVLANPGTEWGRPAARARAPPPPRPSCCTCAFESVFTFATIAWRWPSTTARVVK